MSGLWKRSQSFCYANDCERFLFGLEKTNILELENSYFVSILIKEKFMLNNVLNSIKPLCKKTMKEAQVYVDSLAKPQGSLGKLEQIYIKLCGILETISPEIDKKALLVMAADHGVFEEGVAITPQEVTAIQARNMVLGKTGVCALANAQNAKVFVTDIGIKEDMRNTGVIIRKIRPFGTANMIKEKAMSKKEATLSIEVGIEQAFEKIDSGFGCIGIGEMGIGNTTAASAIVSVITGQLPAFVTGLGANLPIEKLQNKIHVVEHAILKHRPDSCDGIDVLSKVGGLEIGAMAGVIIGCASRRIPVVIDGFISQAAALLAWRLAPLSKQYIFASHRSVEPGAKIALEYLNLDAPLDMDMRLGEGSGAALMFGILQGAVHMAKDMVTLNKGVLAELKENKLGFNLVGEKSQIKPL